MSEEDKSGHQIREDAREIERAWARWSTRKAREPAVWGEPHTSGDRLFGRKYYVDVQTGHLGGLDLCWVCYSVPVLAVDGLPDFRACANCLRYDGLWARRIGLEMLLPLMDWPSQPVAWECDLPAALRSRLIDVWSGVSVLDRWRMSSVRLAAMWMDDPEGIGLDLVSWQGDLGIGRNRSRACFTAFVDGYYPGLLALIRSC